MGFRTGHTGNTAFGGSDMTRNTRRAVIRPCGQWSAMPLPPKPPTRSSACAPTWTRARSSHAEARRSAVGSLLVAFSTGCNMSPQSVRLSRESKTGITGAYSVRPTKWVSSFVVHESQRQREDTHVLGDIGPPAATKECWKIPACQRNGPPHKIWSLIN
jgi:hypothetical protein